MSVPRWLAYSISIIGVGAAVLGAAFRGILKQPYFDTLVSTAISALWLAFLLYVAEQKQRHIVIEGAVKSNMDRSADQSIERGLLMKLLRSGAFEGCSVDAEFWVQYGRNILGDTKLTDSEKLESTLQAMRTGKIEVAQSSSIYSYMHTLLRSIRHRGQTYRAITTPEELTKPEAKNFILQLSKLYPRTIQRILVLPSGTRFEDLQQDVQCALLEVSKVVDMRYLPLPQEDTQNFGIYGNVAVGVLDADGAKNTFYFNPAMVQARNAQFGNLWEQASDLPAEGPMTTTTSAA